MKTIVDYTIITDEYGNIKAVMNEVKKHIKDGWQPHGSLCAGSVAGGNTTLHQAMVKYELVILKDVPSEPETSKEKPKSADTEAAASTTPAP